MAKKLKRHTDRLPKWFLVLHFAAKNPHLLVLSNNFNNVKFTFITYYVRKRPKKFQNDLFLNKKKQQKKTNTDLNHLFRFL